MLSPEVHNIDVLKYNMSNKIGNLFSAGDREKLPGGFTPLLRGVAFGRGVFNA
jgi:hypothetical protein